MEILMEKNKKIWSNNLKENEMKIKEIKIKRKEEEEKILLENENVFKNVLNF